MIERIIRFSIHNKFIVGLFVLALIGWGTWSLTRLPVDAIPDITNNQVQVISLAPSLAVQEVESFITAPIEVAVASIPDIIELRSISRLGLSVVTVVFKDNVDIYWARQQLSERLREAEESIPDGLAKIELAPISTGLGEIYQYRFVVKKGYEQKFTPMDLRTLQDWVVRREMLGTPGVADINSYGGFVKQYEIAVNPERLRGMNLTLTDIFNALEQNNENTGSAYIDKKPTAYFIRGIGLVHSMEDIENIVIKTNASGIPILVRDVARVQYGSATRYGAFVVDTSEAVGGVVMMLKGANAHEVVEQVEERMQSVSKSLPEGVSIEPFLNRSDLVGRAIGTVTTNLLEGALIVIFILVLLLGNFRAGLIVASVIPLSMLFAISMMNLFRVSGNLMSLGAIDFGLIVDGAVIIVESVVHRISLERSRQATQLTPRQVDETVFESARRMMNSATFGQLIILIVYLPILALVGIEGKMFRPMAQVVAFALAGASLLSLTYVPMIASLFLGNISKHGPTISDRIMERIRRSFDPVIGFALQHKRVVSLAALSLFLVSLFLFTRLGGEFIPQLEEGDLAAGVITLQGGSLSNTIEMVKKANKILLENFPEIRHTVCKIGAGEIPTDPTPMETGDYIITLKPKKEWTSAKTREELVAKMEEKLVTLAGVKFEFQQPIQMRFNELMTGSKQDIAVKIFGDDLETLSDKAAIVEKIIAGVEGAEDINVEKVTGLAQVQVDYNRQRMAQYGLSVADVNRILRAAFAGSQAGVVYEEEKRFALVVRLDKDFRQRIEDVRNLSVALPGGGQIPFDQVADIRIKSGPAQVSRESTKRRITVGFNVRNRDVQSVIREVSSRIDREVNLPTGYFVTYGGQFKNLEAARSRLFVAVPVALLLIFVLLYFAFTSVRQTLLIFTAVPLAAMGGVFALWLRGMNFSISAGVGFIALFGVAVLNGIVLISEFNRLEKEGMTDIRERVLTGLRTRLRPVIITAAVASLGFLPMALSTSAGAEVQKPLATVVIGGLITATFLTLVVLPVFYILFSTRSVRNPFSKKNGKRLIPGAGLILLVLLSQPVTAGEPVRMSLQQAIRTALDSNLSVQAGIWSVKAQETLKGATLDLPKTTVEGQYGQFNSFEKDNSFSISQSFSFPTLYLSQHKLATAGIRSSRWQLGMTQLEIATKVKETYWEMVYLIARAHQLSVKDSLFRMFSHAAELRARSGETPRLEMITARTQAMEIRNQLQQVEADIRIASENLRTLLNTANPVLPTDTALVRILFQPATDSSVLLSNPSANFLKEQAELARLEKSVEVNRALPDLSVGYFNQSMVGSQEVNGTARSFGPGDRFTGIQAGITIPVWFGPSLARSKAAGLREQSLKASAGNYCLELTGSYRTQLEELAKQERNLDYYEREALPESGLILNQSRKSYSAGDLDYMDYILLTERAWDIRERYLEALFQYTKTVISLENITGKIL